MTISMRRRGRRPLAAILAAMLMASLLAVVAGSPAQAATTASEVRVDHDRNPKTDKVRQFAGTDRYDTASKLARSFADHQGGVGAVSNVFVASGESLVDSISVSGLAGHLNAPVLLTRTDSLHKHVSDFIEDYAVRNVYVLGGDLAVSDAVYEEIQNLAREPNVDRIEGTDRYATAADIASRIKAQSSWCGTTAKSAVLINGSSDQLSFGVAAATSAFRLQLPLLMTETDELPEATADFLTDADIEHVQIIGDTDVVSASVASAVAAAGVDTVDRTDGASAAAVSVALAEMAANGCGRSLAPLATNRVALVRGNPDGVTAAPVLASSLARGSMVVPLVVGDTLPAEVRAYLAGTPANVGGTRLDLGIVAVGGLKAVSQAVMDAAVEAAQTDGGLTVAIAANEDTNKDGKVDAKDPVRPDATNPVFRMYFSGAVDSTDLADGIRDLLEVNGVRANVTTATLLGGGCSKQAVLVTLGSGLADGDTISVVKNEDVLLGALDDKRVVMEASAKVQAKAPDQDGPTVQIIGIVGQTKWQIRATGADTATISDWIDQTIAVTDLDLTKGTAKVTTPAITTPTHTANTLIWEIAREVKTGEALSLKAGALQDKVGNSSPGSTGYAVETASQYSPKISTVAMSALRHSAQNTWSVPDEVDGGTGGNDVTITAKKHGDADGAAGNNWTIRFDKPEAHSATKPVDIDVRVDTKGKRVAVTFKNGDATVADMLKALAKNTDFTARFAATPTTCTAAALGTKVPATDFNRGTAAHTGATSANAGRTQFAIEVRFNTYIKVGSTDRGDALDTQLLTDVLAQALRRTTTADLNGLLAALTGSGSFGGPGAHSASEYTKTLTFRMEASSVLDMPRVDDRVVTSAGTTDANKVADGYAANSTTVTTDPDDLIKENLNGYSSVLITEDKTIVLPAT